VLSVRTIHYGDLGDQLRLAPSVVLVILTPRAPPGRKRLGAMYARIFEHHLRVSLMYGRNRALARLRLRREIPFRLWIRGVLVRAQEGQCPGENPGLFCGLVLQWLRPLRELWSATEDVIEAQLRSRFFLFCSSWADRRIVAAPLGCELPQVIIQVDLQELTPLDGRHPPE
jgi:hypothetical protein